MRITAITQQQARQDRYSVFVDNEYSFSLSGGALLSAGLIRDQELTSEDLRRFQALAASDKLYDLALGYIALRPRSVWEIESYLARKGAEKADVGSIIERLVAAHLLDDEDFARRWVDNRRTLRSSSRRTLQLELRQKHVPEDIIAIVLRDDSEAVDERDVLRDLITKKRRRYPDQQKLIAYLARQGYRYDDIKAVLSEPDTNY